jgi:capsular polysaccharide biosynthesis protein
MSEQAMDLRRSVQIVRRHRILIGVVALLGLLVGAAYSVLRPPALTSTALVVLPQAAQSNLAPGETGPDGYMATQIVIASSDPVLSGALANLGPDTSLQALRGEVQVKSPTPNILSISAKGTTAAQAEDRANAVAISYVAYITSGHSAFGPVSAHVLNAATSATGRTLLLQVAYSLIGAVLGAVLGLFAALAIRSRDRRLVGRDDIANSIGVPVLASFPVGHPADAAGWVRLLEDYQPGDLYGWRLRHVLQQLGMAGVNVHNGSENGGPALAVVSLSSDPRALALGPQLVAYAASLGIPAALVIAPGEDTTAAATLRTACAAPLPASSERSRYLRAAVSDRADVARRLNAAVTVVVVVVDSQTPQMAGTIPTTATVIGVSAGAASAEQLARVATSAAADGREIAGILVADPEPTDHTTGRIPQPLQPSQHRWSTRPKDTITESRRLLDQTAGGRGPVSAGAGPSWPTAAQGPGQSPSMMRIFPDSRGLL